VPQPINTDPTATSTISVRWRTDIATDSKVWFGTSAAVEDPTSATEHEFRITGLLPDTPCFYAIGSTAGAIASGSE
jgi:hypothetical protein